MVNRGLTGDHRYTHLTMMLGHAEFQLRAYQQYQQQTAFYQQHLSAQKMQNGTPNSSSTALNQAAPKTPSSVAPPTPTPPTPQPMSTPQTPKPDETQVSEESPVQNFTAKQLDQLRSQILVFKSITKQQIVDPDHLTIATGGENIKKLDLSKFDTRLTLPEGVKTIDTHAMPAEQILVRKPDSKMLEDGKVNSSGNSSPAGSPSAGNVTKQGEFDKFYLANKLREYAQRTRITPILKPTGPEPEVLIRENEARCQARMEARIQALSNLQDGFSKV